MKFSSSASPTRADLVAVLRAFDPTQTVSDYRQQRLAGKSPREVIDFTMGPTVMRAFHHETPSQRYPRWRWRRDADLLVERLNGLNDQASFDRLAMELGESLVADWGPTTDRGEPTRMNGGVAMKIANLALKHLTFSEHARCPAPVGWLHVPWDSYTLLPLRGLWLGKPPIPKKVGQGFVKDLGMYQALHELISSVAEEAGVPRINYEFWAWDWSRARRQSS